ncbi:hypothetical protein ACM64Y_16050 [Novispirillum sp. DQ9]|uniref:hypothetical protein n=1 Tax=Novispirillum sp. DQ9 TaxID=3398612 RepID=UPI003C7B8DD1
MRVPTFIALAGVLACLAAAPAGAGGAAAQFLAGFDDLPLMPALTQDAEGATVFESPYGRIAESYASGATTRGAVLDFYAATLPQLGWARTGDTTFRREGEELTLDVTESGGGITVHFLVSPDG